MEEVFGADYSSLYDFIYREKDYKFECSIFERYLDAFELPRGSVLDLGCGTGSHAVELAARGFEVVGVDRSPTMLSLAETKAAESGHEIGFVQSDLRNLSLGRRFESAVMFFAVLGYQITNEAVRAALKTTRDHLETGGLFLFDVWFGPAVLNIGPEQRVKEITTEDGVLLKVSSASLDVMSHVAEVEIRTWAFSDDRVERSSHETHAMRYFFPLELELFLSSAGFDLEEIVSFPEVEEPVTTQTWNVLCVARAV